MRYIYYLVAALIFLAVVNLSARWLGGGDTETATAEADASAANTQTAVAPSPDSEQSVEPTLDDPRLTASAAQDQPPVVAAPEVAATSEAETEPGEVETTDATTVTTPERPEAALTSLADSSKEVALPAAALAEQPQITANQSTGEQTTLPQADTQQASADKATNNVVPEQSAPRVEQTVQATVAQTTDAVVEKAQSSAAAVDEAVDLAADSATETVATPVTTVDATALDSKAQATGDTADSSGATDQPTAEAAAVIGAAIAQAKQSDKVEPSAAAPVVATTPTPDETVAAANDAEESLVTSIIESASKGAEAVVDGAQTAVNTVVGAAASLLDGKESAADPEAIEPVATDLTAAATSPSTEQAELDQPAGTSKADTERQANVAETVAGEAEDKAQDTTTEPAPRLVSSTTETAVSAPTAVVGDAIAKSVAPAVAAAPAVVETVAATAAAKVDAADAEPNPAAAATKAKPVQQTTDVATVAKTRAPTYRNDKSSIAPREVHELLQQNPGKHLLLGFFTADCDNCRDSLRWMNEMRRQYWAKGLQVIGVNVGSPAAGKAFLEDSPVSFEVKHDTDRQLAAAVWLSEQPSTYLIGPDGTLLSQHQGHSDLKLGEYEDNIRAAIAR